MLPFLRVECEKQSDQNVTSHSSVTVHVIGEEMISSCLMSILLWTFPNVVDHIYWKETTLISLRSS